MKEEKYIKVDSDLFKHMTYKVNVLPLGDKTCCCGVVDCVDAECLAEVLAPSN